jgi:hypothetical protein
MIILKKKPEKSASRRNHAGVERGRNHGRRRGFFKGPEEENKAAAEQVRERAFPTVSTTLRTGLRSGLDRLEKLKITLT